MNQEKQHTKKKKSKKKVSQVRSISEFKFCFVSRNFMESKMEKDAQSLTVQMKPDYASSEVYSTVGSEAPPVSLVTLIPTYTKKKNHFSISMTYKIFSHS